MVWFWFNYNYIIGHIKFFVKVKSICDTKINIKNLTAILIDVWYNYVLKNVVSS